MTGQNQKQRIQALEAALGQVESVNTSLVSPPPTSSGTDSFPDTTSTIPLSSILSASACDDQSSWINEPAWKKNDTQSVPGLLGDQGRTALHFAVGNGDESMSRLLLDRGADIMRQDSTGSTPLHLAAECGSEELVKLLLEKSANPNETDLLGRTVLFGAVSSGSEVVVKMLLDALVDVNAKDSLGNVALHLAVESGSESLVVLLLEYGANIDA